MKSRFLALAMCLIVAGMVFVSSLPQAQAAAVATIDDDFYFHECYAQREWGGMIGIEGFFESGEIPPDEMVVKVGIWTSGFFGEPYLLEYDVPHGDGAFNHAIHWPHWEEYVILILYKKEIVIENGVPVEKLTEMDRETVDVAY